jgi:hypothetical protein
LRLNIPEDEDSEDELQTNNNVDETETTDK